MQRWLSRLLSTDLGRFDKSSSVTGGGLHLQKPIKVKHPKNLCCLAMGHESGFSSTPDLIAHISLTAARGIAPPPSKSANPTNWVESSVRPQLDRQGGNEILAPC